MDQRLLVLGKGNDSGGATYVEVPWVVSSDDTLFGTSNFVYAYVRDWTTGQISVWRTGDGYVRTGLDPLHVKLGAPSSFNFQVAVLPALQMPATQRPIRDQVVVAMTHASPKVRRTSEPTFGSSVSTRDLPNTEP